MYPEYFFELTSDLHTESVADWSEYEVANGEGIADSLRRIDEVNFQLSDVAEDSERMRKPMRRAGEMTVEFDRRSYRAN